MLKSANSEHRILLYSKYTPLGFNCELGFLLEQKGISQENEFFAWTEVRPPSVELLIRHKFKNVGCEENLKLHPFGHLVIDDFYGLSFHSPLANDNTNAFGTPAFERLHYFFVAGLERKARLFQEELSSSRPIAYLAKYDGPSPHFDAVLLRDAIAARRPQAPFVLVFVQERERSEPSWQEENIVNRYVDRFSPIYASNDVDHASWEAALSGIQTENA